MKMQWEKLLSLKRQGDSGKRLRIDQDDTRLGFEVDYDRIVFSSAFRSLQDKTQVIPFSKTDFVHTRLTHSIEVSVVARSLGRIVGKKIIEKYPYLQEIHGYKSNDFGAIVASAALAHDIGNPPFGHSGEKAIGAYFSLGNGKKYKEKLSEKEWQDLISFEGNANGFSILSTSRKGVEGGLRLSYATLGAFMKYPKESLPIKPNQNIYHKKYGFFQQDKLFFNEVAKELELLPSLNNNSIAYVRHPLAFLVEAADDICYTIIDFEDAINLKLIEEEVALEYLIKLVSNNLDKNKYALLQTTQDRISYIRALAINTLINEVTKIFIDNEEQILSGNFSTSLLEKSKYKAQIEDIIAISIKRMYQSKEVVEKEIIGYQTINTLLDNFINAYINKNSGIASHYDSLIYKLLPEIYQHNSENLYLQILHICQFVSTLTDSKVLQYYNIIKQNAI